MEKYYQNHIRMLFTILILFGILITSLFLFFTDKIINYNSEIVHSMEMEDSKEEMRRLVDNLIVRIEDTRKKTWDEGEDMISFIEEAIRRTENKEKLYTIIQSYLKELKIGRMVEIIAIDKNRDNYGIKFDRNNRIALEITREEIHDKIHSMALYKNVETEEYIYHIMISEEKINEYVKDMIYDEVHHTIYGNQYIWINEVINYEGGDRYAIRLIHPNLKKSEGEFLSTDMQDAAGNYPYQKELEGINLRGEIFHTYYFKNLINDNVAEKLSYAKLYEPYNWIIATGEPLEDILGAANGLDRATKDTAKKLIIAFLGIELILLMGIIYLQKKYQSNISVFIKQETEIDGLTGAFSRKSGEKILQNAFEKHRTQQSAYMVAVIDIDHFKKVNDTYGHTVGDQVLTQMVYKIKSCIRETDYLIRWGGDEFILLCSGVDSPLQRGIANKILECARKLNINTPQGIVHTTLSVGYSSFFIEDANYQKTLERIDKALYFSKEKGRNCCSDYAELVYRKEKE